MCNEIILLTKFIKFMKKMFYTLGVSIMFCSCSTTVYDSDFEQPKAKSIVISTQNSYVDLQNDIADLNKGLENPKARGFWSRLFGRVLNVFVSDCVGAVRGVFSGGNVWQSAQGASLTSAKKQSFITLVDGANMLLAKSSANINKDVPVISCMQPREFGMDGLVFTSEPGLATINDSIGYYHNYILYEALEKENSANYWVGVSDYACVLEVNEEIKNQLQNIYVRCCCFVF